MCVCYKAHISNISRSIDFNGDVRADDGAGNIVRYVVRYRLLYGPESTRNYVIEADDREKIFKYQNICFISKHSQLKTSSELVNGYNIR